MHEANNASSADPSQESLKRVRISKTTKDPEKSTTGSGGSVVLDDGRENERSGDTPSSVGVRVDGDSQDMDYSTGSSASVASMASDADLTEVLPGTVR
jgi:hypothetical protein